jgi:hypothetical protein
MAAELLLNVEAALPQDIQQIPAACLQHRSHSRNTFLNVEALLPEEVELIPAALELNQDEKARDEAARQLSSRLCSALQAPTKSPQLKALLQCLTDCIAFLPPAKLVKDQVFRLAMDGDGCRLVQAALQEGSRGAQSDIVAELKGHVCEMVASPHANHVLQRLIELLPPSSVRFVLEEMTARWSPDYIAKHKFGCRVLARILEHFPGSCAPLASFLDTLLENAEAHCFHAMATFMMQHLLEHGSEKHKAIIVAAVCSNLEKAALDSHASGVLDKALTLMAPEEQQHLTAQVLMVPGLLAKMAQSNKAAAARLLLLAQGWHLAEAHRQICQAFPESVQRVRMIHSLFCSKSPPPSLTELFAQDAYTELQAPIAQTMGVVVCDASYQGVCMVVPQQESMIAMDSAAWPGAASEQQAMWMTAPQGMYMWTA